MDTENSNLTSLLTPTFRSLIAGSAAGSLSVLVCHPLDVLRVRIQTQQQHRPTDYSIRALYRGLIPPFLAQAAYKAVIFSTNEAIKRILEGPTFNFKNDYHFGTIFVSGFIAGFVNSFLVSPVELIRTRQIINHTSISLEVDRIIRRDGFQSLWRALPSTILRDSIGVGIYLTTFEFSKSLLANQNLDRNNCSNAQRFLAGSLSGLAFWIWALPIDTVKSNIEVSSFREGGSHYCKSTKSNIAASTWQTTKRLIADGGFRALFHSWPVAFGRGIPSAAVTLTSYDYFYEALGDI